MNKRLNILILSFFTGFILPACKKFIQVAPPNNLIVSDVVFQNDSTAKAAISGIYSEMMNNSNQFCAGAQTLYAGLCADELYYYSPSVSYDEYYKNEITQATHASVLSFLFWEPAYKYIYISNLCIEKLNSSQSLSPAVKSQLTGEAKFIRAFCYFNLVNLFGDVPLVMHTDYTENQRKARTSTDEVYSQMISDLEDARNLLAANYPTSERTRANKLVATALLARVYLYKKDWANAEAMASMVINSGQYNLVSLSNVFLRNSNEAILQLQPVNPNINTWEGNSMLPASPTATPTFLVSSSLLNSFESNDQRKIVWINSRVYSTQTVFYPAKYKIYSTSSSSSEYYTVLRLAEQYLIRAEARANSDQLQPAVDDINAIRIRAGLPAISYSLSKDQVLLAIQQERKTELMFEWGHRWFDLKRTGRADSILSALKPGTWQATDKLWPIPINQLNANPNLTQNAGY